MKLKRKSIGAAAVEFALAATVFFTVLFSIIDFGYLFWVNLTMQHAVREGARSGILRESDCGNAESVMKQQSMGLWDKVGAYDLWQVYDPAEKKFVGPAANCVSPDQASIRKSGNVVVVSVICQAPILTPFIRPFFTNGVYGFTVSATARME